MLLLFQNITFGDPDAEPTPDPTPPPVPNTTTPTRWELYMFRMKIRTEGRS